MPIYLLSEEHPELFPPPERADKSGVLAVGGDLSPERLLAAYSRGIFPWFSAGDPILWHSPDPRFVLEPDKLHVGRSLRKTMARGDYEVRYDTAFARVITECGRVSRPGQTGTWITDEMLEAYVALHERGFAHSVEAWAGGELKGGLYGVSLGAAFFGESMFALAPDASKVAFATAVERFKTWGFQFIDCQVETEHLARFGAEDWTRKRFLTALRRALDESTRQGSWTEPTPS
ncbi:leucyl/phenylalanyl-tRNA--protein transferase [Myxococcus stipitatus DSM 14675]|uniref:Leucyl/phenylalanyl-tRNA--protein transferase n=1 Tax=Myxococcus stipitatus (strain DSM 14675 / JCM 12634 / Mx s8) TaxID=1278073 RepID=L7U515_MYXSD|nr:leucyl/phenylalanyl-tRNA--protein transferase [Myxococcus stipitatus]AGC42667.1 leucyl/phenylalanyl-tRNA--protein transferase [Myxococcus stipitatus DSM 14675]